MRAEDASDYIALLTDALSKAKDQKTKDNIKAKIDAARLSLEQITQEPPPVDP